jgi:hypothetical protein
MMNHTRTAVSPRIREWSSFAEAVSGAWAPAEAVVVVPAAAAGSAAPADGVQAAVPIRREAVATAANTAEAAFREPICNETRMSVVNGGRG